jgi:hypothetical protein
MIAEKSNSAPQSIYNFFIGLSIRPILKFSPQPCPTLRHHVWMIGLADTGQWLDAIGRAHTGDQGVDGQAEAMRA